MSYNTIIQKIFLSSKNSVSFVAIGKDIDTGELTESTRHFIDTTKDYAEQLQLDSRFMKEINIIYEENNISEEIVKNLSNALTDADNKKFALTESGKSTWESLSQLVFINYGQTTCESVEYLLEYVGKSKMISNFGIHTCSSVKNTEMVNILGSVLKINTSINNLFLRLNHLDDNDVYVIMKSLKDNTSIEYIDLSANNITEKGVKYLVESNWYQRQEKLIPVLLSSNIIGDDGVKNLVNYFEEALAHYSHNKRLGSINLASNKISSAGAKMIAEFLNKYEKLVGAYNVDLYDNNIDDQGAGYLLSAQKRIMREIDIGDNNISNEFTMNIASSEYVDFLGNPRVVEVVPYEDRFENYNSGDLRIYLDYHKIIHDISCNDYMIVNEENISKNEL